MKAFVVLPFALAIAGCGAELLTTTAISGQLHAQAARAATQQLHDAQDSADRIKVEQAIKLFHADKGFNPPTLQALVPQFLDAVPQGIYYVPATAQVTDAAGAAAADQQTIAAIHGAITAYGTQIGYYPPTLDALAPVYLAAPPRTVDGREFIYNNQNGQVVHPNQMNAAAPAGSAGGQRATPMGGGAGPMGEVMTGIGMQQQMNRNSNAGTNSVGNYGRQTVRGIGADHSNRQMQQINELGL